MEKITCPKCENVMDEGRVSPSGSGIPGNDPERQTGTMSQVAPISRARLNCGYLELYLDPAELKK